MNFYFNYFASIGRAQIKCHVTLSRCFFLKRLTFERSWLLAVSYWLLVVGCLY